MKNVPRLTQILKNIFHLNYISEEIKYSNNTKKYYDDRVIAIFYKFMHANLNDCKRARTEKGQQTKHHNEHYDDLMLLFSMNTRTEKANNPCNQSILILFEAVANQRCYCLFTTSTFDVTDTRI